MLIYNTTTNTLHFKNGMGCHDASGMLTIPGEIISGANYVQATPEIIYEWMKVTVKTDHKTYMKIRLNNPSDFIRKK